MPFGRQLANAMDCNTEVNRQRALELRITGARYIDIAQALTCSKSTAYRLVNDALAEQKEINAEKAEQVRDIEIARLDGLLFSLWPKRADPRVTDSLLRIAERRSRLLGLDAPEQVRIGGASGEPLTHLHGGWDLSALSVDQLLQLEQITAAATAHALPAPPPVPAPASP